MIQHNISSFGQRLAIDVNMDFHSVQFLIPQRNTFVLNYLSGHRGGC